MNRPDGISGAFSAALIILTLATFSGPGRFRCGRQQHYGLTAHRLHAAPTTDPSFRPLLSNNGRRGRHSIILTTSVSTKPSSHGATCTSTNTKSYCHSTPPTHKYAKRPRRIPSASPALSIRNSEQRRRFTRHTSRDQNRLIVCTLVCWKYW